MKRLDVKTGYNMYYVEVYSVDKLEHVADVGPFDIDKARAVHRVYTSSGLLAMVTEAEEKEQREKNTSLDDRGS